MRFFTAILLILLTSCGQSAPDPIVTWRTAVETEVNSLLTTLNDFSQHMPRYYDDATARQAVERDIESIQQTHQRLSQLDVPASRTQVHARVLDAAGDCVSGMDAYRAAFRTNNTPNTAAAGQQLVQRCTTKLEELRRKLPSA